MNRTRSAVRGDNNISRTCTLILMHLAAVCLSKSCFKLSQFGISWIFQELSLFLLQVMLWKIKGLLGKIAKDQPTRVNVLVIDQMISVRVTLGKQQCPDDIHEKRHICRYSQHCQTHVWGHQCGWPQTSGWTKAADQSPCCRNPPNRETNRHALWYLHDSLAHGLPGHMRCQRFRNSNILQSFQQSLFSNPSNKLWKDSTRDCVWCQVGNNIPQVSNIWDQNRNCVRFIEGVN